MSKIFISYRRSDTTAIAGRILDRFLAHFGTESIFIDIDNIPYGVDFRVYLNRAINECDVVLALIGDRWLELDLNGNPRINNSSDFVRIELEVALLRSIPLIPVLVDGARLPTPNHLPRSLHDLSYRNAIQLNSGRDFNTHMNRLISTLEYIKPAEGSGSAKKELKPTNDHYIKQQSSYRFHLLMFLPQSILGWLSRIILFFSISGSLAGTIVVLSKGSSSTNGDITTWLPFLFLSFLSYAFSRHDGKKWLDSEKAFEKSANTLYYQKKRSFRFRWLMFLPQTFWGWIVRLTLAFTSFMTIVGSIVILSKDTGTRTESDANTWLFLFIISCILYFLSRIDGKKWLKNQVDK